MLETNKTESEPSAQEDEGLTDRLRHGRILFGRAILPRIVDTESISGFGSAEDERLRPARHTQAVVEALTRLGENAPADQIAEAIKRDSGLALNQTEIAQIVRQLREQAALPPGPDQPSPQSIR